MKQLTPTQADQQSRIKAEQMRIWMEHTGRCSWNILLFSLLLLGVLYAATATWQVIAWFACMTTAISAHFWWNKGRVDKKVDQQAVLLLMRPKLVQTTLVGILFASAIVWMPQQLEGQLLVMGMMVLAVVVGMMLCPNYLPAVVASAAPTFLGLAGWCFGQGAEIYHMIAVLLLSLFSVLLLMLVNLGETWVHSLKLSFENEALRQHLVFFKDALEHAAEPITIFNAHSGQLTYSNPAFSYMTGFKTDDLEGESWHDIYSNFNVAKSLFYKEKASLSGLPWSGTLRVKTTTEDLDVSCGFSPVRDSSGEVKGLVCIQRDVREENMMQQKMEKLNRMEALSLMAASVAHDFNNILTAILGNAQLVEMQSEGNPKAKHSTQRIIRSVSKATILCKQMLAYSGKGSFQREALLLTHIIEDMKKPLDKAIGQQWKIEYACDPDVGMVEGDEVEIRQLMMNLTLNASEALEGRGRDGLIMIHLSKAYMDQASLSQMHTEPDGLHHGEYVRLTITDNGEGISPECMGRIFEPFFSTRFIGRGLGLSAVDGIVRGHGGGISVLSDTGFGTSVIVVFPMMVA